MHFNSVDVLTKKPAYPFSFIDVCNKQVAALEGYQDDLLTTHVYAIFFNKDKVATTLTPQELQKSITALLIESGHPSTSSDDCIVHLWFSVDGMINLRIQDITISLSAYLSAYWPCLPAYLSDSICLSFLRSVCGPLALVQSLGLTQKGNAVRQKEEGNWLGWQLVSTDTAGVGERSQRQAQSCIAISTSKEWQTRPWVRDRGEKHHPKTMSHLSWSSVAINISDPGGVVFLHLAHSMWMHHSFWLTTPAKKCKVASYISSSVTCASDQQRLSFFRWGQGLKGHKEFWEIAYPLTDVFARVLPKRRLNFRAVIGLLILPKFPSGRQYMAETTQPIFPTKLKFIALLSIIRSLCGQKRLNRKQGLML